MDRPSTDWMGLAGLGWALVAIVGVPVSCVVAIGGLQVLPVFALLSVLIPIALAVGILVTRSPIAAFPASAFGAILTISFLLIGFVIPAALMACLSLVSGLAGYETRAANLRRRRVFDDEPWPDWLIDDRRGRPGDP